MQVDGGANCHVFNEERFFFLLYKKKINVDIALGVTSTFQGIELVAMQGENPKLKILGPSYYAPQEKVCTISPGAIKQYSGYTQAATYSLEHLLLVTTNGIKHKVPVTTKNGLNCIKLTIHHFNSPLKTKTQHHPFLTTTPKYNKIDKHKDNIAMYLHLKFGHMNMDYINTMIKMGLIKGVNKQIGTLCYDCPLCIIASATKITKGITAFLPSFLYSSPNFSWYH